MAERCLNMRRKRPGGRADGPARRGETMLVSALWLWRWNDLEESSSVIDHIQFAVEILAK